MGWAEIFALIAQVGLPVAQALITKWTTATPVTPETVTAALNEAMALGKKTPTDILMGVLAAKGIPTSDPRAMELIKLVGA